MEMVVATSDKALRHLKSMWNLTTSSAICVIYVEILLAEHYGIHICSTVWESCYVDTRTIIVFFIII